jgi:hypothetical protein
MKTKLWLLTGLVLVALLSSLGAQDFSITIDAQKDAWYDGLTGPEDGYVYLPYRADTDITLSEPTGDSDISGLFWMAWDENYLYFYGEVTDNILVVNGAASWSNDGIELKIDPDPTVPDEATGNATSCAQARMTAFGEENATCDAGLTCWDNVNTANEMGTAVAITAEDWARTETDAGYAVEFRIPWPNITAEGRSVNVGVGNTFGLAVNFGDNDGTGRETQLQWSAGMVDAAWNDVRQHGTVEFLADHKLRMIPTNSSATNEQLLPCQEEGFEFPANDSAEVWYTPPTPGSGTTGAFGLTIDAERDTWYDGLTGPEEGYVFIPSRATNMEFAAPGSDVDLSASFWLAWDETYFYVYGEVTDEVLDVTSATGGWDNDGVSFRMDANPNVADTSPGNGNANVEMTAFGPGDPRATGAVLNLGGFIVTEDDYARQDYEGGYAIEFRLPWAQLITEGRTVTPAVDNTVGLSIVVADNDAGSREGQIQWSAVMSDLTWTDGRMLGTAKLLPDNKIELIPVNSAACPPPTPPQYAHNDSAAVWYDPAFLVSVEGPFASNPEEFGLAQNYPNPFNPTTHIQYTLKAAESVTLAIYNINGQLIRTLIHNQNFHAGTYRVSWDGQNDNGINVSTGVYLYKLTTESFTESKKMLLMK